MMNRAISKGRPLLPHLIICSIYMYCEGCRLELIFAKTSRDPATRGKVHLAVLSFGAIELGGCKFPLVGDSKQ